MDHKEIERWYRLKNIKKTAQVLILVSLVLLFSSYAASRFLGESVEKFDTLESTHGAVKIENFVYSSPGARPWELRASNALVSDSLDRVDLRNPVVTYYGGKGGTVYLSAVSGQLDKKTSKVSGRGGVVIQYRDFRFTTGKIDYSDDRQRAETTSPVALEGGDMSLTGIGLKLCLESEEIVIENNVRARLYDVKWVEPGQKMPM